MWSSKAPARVNVALFFFNDTATTEIYTLSLHDALPIFWGLGFCRCPPACRLGHSRVRSIRTLEDRKSTRLNSSHGYISYAVFCLKKKKNSGVTAHQPQHSRT